MIKIVRYKMELKKEDKISGKYEQTENVLLN